MMIHKKVIRIVGPLVMLFQLNGMSRTLTGDLILVAYTGEKSKLITCIENFKENRPPDRVRHALRQALFNALSSKNVSTVEGLLEQGAPVNLLDDQERLPIDEAVLFGSEECIELLIAHGAFSQLSSEGARSLVAKAVVRDNRAALFKLMHYSYHIFRPTDEEVVAAKSKIRTLLLVFHRLQKNCYPGLNRYLQSTLLLASSELTQDIASIMISHLHNGVPLSSLLMTEAKEATVNHLLTKAACCFEELQAHQANHTLDTLNDSNGTLTFLDDEAEADVRILLEPANTYELFNQVVRQGLEEKFFSLTGRKRVVETLAGAAGSEDYPSKMRRTVEE